MMSERVNRRASERGVVVLLAAAAAAAAGKGRGHIINIDIFACGCSRFVFGYISASERANVEGRGPGSITQNCPAPTRGRRGKGELRGRQRQAGGRIDNIALTLYALALCIYVNASRAAPPSRRLTLPTSAPLTLASPSSSSSPSYTSSIAESRV